MRGIDLFVDGSTSIVILVNRNELITGHRAVEASFFIILKEVTGVVWIIDSAWMSMQGVGAGGNKSIRVFDGGRIPEDIVSIFEGRTNKLILLIDHFWVSDLGQSVKAVIGKRGDVSITIYGRDFSI